MDCEILCECGREHAVRQSMAGASIDCECGRTVTVPSLSALKQRTASSAASQTRPALTRRKKFAYTLLTLMIVAGPGWVGLEIAYRMMFQIPLVGGVVTGDEGRLPDTTSNRAVVARFRRSENPILLYEPNPGAKAGIYAINSAGFRDHEYSAAKDSDVFRIAVLGDSIVWGHGLELKDTFAKQLDAMLNDESKRPFEVLNFGVSGYSTQQEVELYRVKVQRYDPDLVIVGYCLNDFEESSVEGEAFKHLYYDVFSRSYLYDHLRRVIAGVSYNQFGYLADAPQAQFDLHEQFRLLESYRDHQRSLVVIFPVLEDFGSYLYAVDHRRIHDALRGLNYETLDLLDVYREHSAESLILADHDRTHPNALGTRLAAEATLKVLAETELAPINRDRVNAK